MEERRSNEGQSAALEGIEHGSAAAAAGKKEPVTAPASAATGAEVDEAASDRQARENLLFDIRRSIRYHERRTAFFERMHRVTDLITILLAGVVLSELLGSPSRLILQILAGLGALLSASDLVIGYGRRADGHRRLKRQFIFLEADVSSGKELNTVARQRLNIEADEPPAYRALDVLCHNQLCRAFGKPRCELYRVPWWMRWTAHLLHWSDVEFVPLEARPQDSSIRPA